MKNTLPKPTFIKKSLVLTSAIAISSTVLGHFSITAQAQDTTLLSPLSPSATAQLLDTDAQNTTELENTSETNIFYSEKNNVLLNYSTSMNAVETAQGEALVTLVGPTQTSSVQLTDGIEIYLSKVTLAESTFEQYVESEHTQYLDVSAEETIGEITPTTLADVSGYSFTETTQNTVTHYYLPINETTVLEISVELNDPTNQGYETLVENLLNSLVIVTN